jgi:hypothetical protein
MNKIFNFAVKVLIVMTTAISTLTAQFTTNGGGSFGTNVAHTGTAQVGLSQSVANARLCVLNPQNTATTYLPELRLERNQQSLNRYWNLDLTGGSLNFLTGPSGGAATNMFSISTTGAVLNGAFNATIGSFSSLGISTGVFNVGNNGVRFNVQP